MTPEFTRDIPKYVGSERSLFIYFFSEFLLDFKCCFLGMGTNSLPLNLLHKHDGHLKCRVLSLAQFSL